MNYNDTHLFLSIGNIFQVFLCYDSVLIHSVKSTNNINTKRNLSTSLYFQPVTRPNFLNLIRQNHIGIENVVVNHFTLTGTILVHNLCFSKAVCIRSSRNYWLTHTDTSAEFLSSVAPDIDKFKFTLALPATLPPGARVEMCARLMAGGETFWDNNFSQNYQIKSVALPPSASSTLPLPPTVSAKHARAVGTKNARAVNAKHAPETVYY